MQYLKIFSLLFLLVWMPNLAKSQNSYQLGMEYLNNGELEKAEQVFEKLFAKTPENDTYYKAYFKTLLEQKKYDKAKKISSDLKKRSKGFYGYRLDLAQTLRLMGDNKKADDELNGVISSLPTESMIYQTVIEELKIRQEYNAALKLAQMGKSNFPRQLDFYFTISSLYDQLNDNAGFINSLFDLVEIDPSQITHVQNSLQGKLEEKDYDDLRVQLLKRAQENPDKFYHQDLLIWFFVQKKDFNAAFIQSKALDKRMDNNGNRILTLARTAVENNAFDAAIEMYDYVIEKGPNGAFYPKARYEITQARKAKIEHDLGWNITEFQKLEAEYKKFLQDFGLNAGSILVQKDLSELQAFYLNNLDEAASGLEKALELKGVPERGRAELKLSLGDIYLLEGDLWEPSLLYGQVDQDFKQDAIAREAKFRNARLSFFRSEFEWSQAQLDILKGATQEMISNDAIELSLLIQDNLGLDTTEVPLTIFAEGMLLAYRNQFDQAASIYDSLLTLFPNHVLTDEVWFQKGKMAEKQRNWDEAFSWYSKILELFPDDILADHALFKMASIKERIGEKENAMKLYEQLLLKYSNSTFAVEARKRFRTLRGDQNL